MTQATMTPSDISDRAIQLSLHTADRTETTARNGNTTIRTYGRLDNERPVVLYVSTTGEMLVVTLKVPGAGLMGFKFSLFADDATEERIERYLKYYVGLHEKAKDRWDAIQRYLYPRA